MKRVLYIAYYFPPVLEPGAMRPMGFCRYLRRYGWEPWVVTATPGSAASSTRIDDELLGHLPPDIRVETVEHRDLLRKFLRWRESLKYVRRKAGDVQARHPASMAPNGQTLGRGQSRRVRDLFLDWAFAFPDRQRSWKRAVLRRLSTVPREARPDVVLATGGPWTNYLIGLELARRFEVPLVLDYRDPWSCNPYTPFSWEVLNQRARVLEQSICRAASRIVTNTNELREKLCGDYPEIAEKCVTISNGFDPEIVGRTSELPDRSSQHAEEEGVELSHFGTIYGKRNPHQLFEAIWALHEAKALTPEQFRLRFVGSWEQTTEQCETLAKRLEKRGFLRREPLISHQRCIEQMKRADVLLVLQPDSPLQIPQKIYEYLAIGRPIVLIGGQGATANLLANHHLPVGCLNDATHIRTMIQSMVAGELVPAVPSSGLVERFDYRVLAGELAGQLDAALQG